MNSAEITLRQLGGNRFKVMTGARDFVSCNNGDTLRFRLPRYSGLKINLVNITLNWRDLYDVEFGSVSKSRGVPSYSQMSKFDNIHADDLVSLFERETGLATRL